MFAHPERLFCRAKVPDVTNVKDEGSLGIIGDVQIAVMCGHLVCVAAMIVKTMQEFEVILGLKTIDNNTGLPVGDVNQVIVRRDSMREIVCAGVRHELGVRGIRYVDDTQPVGPIRDKC